MIAKMKHTIVDIQPMSRYEYFDIVKKDKYQHGENKFIEGYYCNLNGYRFWITKDDFNNLFEIIDES